MLEKSIDRLNALSPELRTIAEHMAHATIVSELVEDLIPVDQAERIASDHRDENTEEWRRAVYAAVLSLLALDKLGYRLARTPKSEAATDKSG